MRMTAISCDAVVVYCRSSQLQRADQCGRDGVDGGGAVSVVGGGVGKVLGRACLALQGSDPVEE